MELWRYSVAELTNGYARHEFSPTEVVEAALGRVSSSDPLLGAFRQVLGDSARVEAARATEALARGETLGPLHGVPVAVKELIDVEGAIGCYGSVVMQDRVSDEDAEVVRRLRLAGAVVMGVTRSHEFGWGITTQHARLGGTRNPWDPTRVPGGSSGGSAAAVASGMVPLALGTDTGGSIRIPASYCGVVGLKPAFGRISTRGVVPLATSLDHVGLLARTVQDIAAALPLLARFGSRNPATRNSPPPPSPERPFTGDLRSVRIATAPGLHSPRLDPRYEQVFLRALQAAADCGAQLVELAIGDPGRIRDAFATIQMAEALHCHSAVLGTYPSRADDYGDDVRQRLELATGISLSDYISARAEALRVRQRFDSALEGVDALITPVTAGPPSFIATPDVVRHLGHDLPFRDLVMGYTVPQDLTGLPACAIPAGFDQAGLPVSIQITGPSGREANPLQIGLVLERALGFPGFPPDHSTTA